MANSASSYSDAAIMKCLLTKNFSTIGRVFEDNVITSIKPGAFYQATNLDRVTLPNVVDIGDFAFAECNAATIDIPWASIQTIRSYAFLKCASANLPGTLNLAALTVLDSGAFAGVSGSPNTWLTSISLPQWTGTTTGSSKYQTSSFGVFEYCTALTSISLPELVATPTYMARYCSSLTELVLPKCSSIGTSSIQSCTSLTKVDIGGALTRLSSSQFSGCNSLNTLILRGITTVPTLNASAFTGSGLTGSGSYIYVPKSLEETIKVASNWSNYAAKIRAVEDYPDVCGS